MNDTTYNAEDPLAVYLVINGPLQMTAGKIAAQTFQACQRLLHSNHTAEQKQALDSWLQEGTCTCTRIAETDNAFERVCDELDGVLMVDEGMTEVPEDSPTVFASFPVRRSKLPRMLKHKRVKVLVTEPVGTGG